MSSLGPTARRFISDRLDDHVEEVDAAPLHNAIADADDGAPETLHHLATAAEAAQYASDAGWDRDRDTLVEQCAADAHADAMDGLRAFIDELVAETCADVIQTVDEWEWPDDEQAAQSKHEAREWLQRHTQAAKRAGVFEDLDVEATA